MFLKINTVLNVRKKRSDCVCVEFTAAVWCEVDDDNDNELFITCFIHSGFRIFCVSGLACVSMNMFNHACSRSHQTRNTCMDNNWGCWVNDV